MKKIFFIIPALVLTIICAAQNEIKKNDILYGRITKEDLMTAPFNKWFDSSYAVYKPDEEIINAIKKLNTKDISLQVFMGTWCGDSRREVPRLLKIVNELGWPATKVTIIAVGSSDSLYKQSPNGEEAGKGLYRVPPIIIYKNGAEINRINEFAVMSLERDLLNILTTNDYHPNYRSFTTIRNWVSTGMLLDKNNSSRGFAMQLKYIVNGENELNGVGYILLKQNKKEEALKIFLVNTNLYPESANVLSSLGEGYLRNGDNKNAVVYLERALEYNKEPLMLKSILKLLYEAKGVKE
ncbi:MAG: hypothetical protein ABI480_14000 [Chitinophagaceae bacterium]